MGILHHLTEGLREVMLALNLTHELIENFYIFGLVLNSFSLTREMKDYVCFFIDNYYFLNVAP